MRECNLPLKAIYFCQEKMVSGSFRDCKCIIERPQSSVWPTCLGKGFRKQALEPRTGEPGVHGLIPIQSGPYLVQSIINLAEFGQCPSPQNGRLMLPMQEPMF